VVLIAPLVDSPVESGKRLVNDSPVSDIEATNATTATRIAIRFGTLWIVFPISFLSFLSQIVLSVSDGGDYIKCHTQKQETKWNKGNNGKQV
jgi:hypothetical protein